MSVVDFGECEAPVSLREGDHGRSPDSLTLININRKGLMEADPPPARILISSVSSVLNLYEQDMDRGCCLYQMNLPQKTRVRKMGRDSLKVSDKSCVCVSSAKAGEGF